MLGRTSVCKLQASVERVLVLVHYQTKIGSTVAFPLLASLNSLSCCVQANFHHISGLHDRDRDLVAFSEDHEHLVLRLAEGNDQTGRVYCLQ